VLLLKGHAEGALPGLLPAVFSRYETHLAAAVASGACARLLDGVGETLTALAARSDCRLALLTGNLAGGARLKLEAAGIAGYFSAGAFGSDDADRNRLGPIARARAETAFGERYADDAVFVIGDSPHDIACARAAGFRAVAVASGRHSVEELSFHRPDLLLGSLTEPGLPALLG
jgi:phosphoglycolate phosphatase-like HAD superfamily hydrolase